MVSSEQQKLSRRTLFALPAAIFLLSTLGGLLYQYPLEKALAIAGIITISVLLVFGVGYFVTSNRRRRNGE